MAVVVAVALACVEDEHMLHAKGVLRLIRKGNLGSLETDVRNCHRRKTATVCRTKGGGVKLKLPYHLATTYPNTLKAFM